MNTLIDRYSPSLAAVYDYYPFGMLMPGRFKQDSASHCMVSTQTMLVPVTIKVAGPVSGPLVPVLGGTGTVITGGVLVSSHSPGDGVSVSTPVTAGLTITLELEVSQLSGAPFAVLVKEPVGAQDLVLGGATLSASGMYKVTVTPGGSTLKLVYVGGGVGSVVVKPWTWTKSLLTPKNVPVLVCNETEDYRFGFNGQQKDNEVAGIGNHLDFGARGLDTRIGKWWSVDPLASKYPGVSPYAAMNNNPILNKDEDGREPIKALAGTVTMFMNVFNNSPSRIGQTKGAEAGQALIRLGSTEFSWKQMRPLPTTTPYFNNREARYIYTEKGGWVDMVHFLFYAGKAYGYKQEQMQAQKALDGMRNGPIPARDIPGSLIKKATQDPVGEAVQDGYQQEMSDRAAAKYSAYSYEDLPTDKLGADFGANYFDPNSKSSLGEQLSNYLNDKLGATTPENAPNYETLPTTEPTDKPTRTNHTTKPVYTKDNP